MPSTINGSVTSTAGTGTIVSPSLNQSGAVGDNLAVIEVSGTFTTVTGTFQVTADGTNWQNVAAIRNDTFAIEQTPTLTNSTVRQWFVPITGSQYVRVNITAVSTGTVTFQINTLYQVGGLNLVLASALAGNQAITGNLVVTSTSANALAVGAGGTTNPAINVDASTGSSATGLNIKSAASGSGIALSALGGTNEPITINTKGTGAITFQNATAPPLNGAANASILFSANASFGIYFGTGVPTISAAQGSLFLATNGSSTSTRAFIANNSAGGWTAVTTAA